MSFILLSLNLDLTRLLIVSIFVSQPQIDVPRSGVGASWVRAGREINRLRKDGTRAGKRNQEKEEGRRKRDARDVWGF